MFQKWFSFGSVLLLAGALVFATAAPGEAAPHRVGRVGGAHFSGARIGGANIGGVHVGGARIGGFHGGFRGFSVGPRFGSSFRGFGYRSYGLGYPYWGLGGYGYYPYYGSYGYPYSSTYIYPYSNTYVVPDSTLYGGYEEAEPYVQTPPAAVPDLRAHVTVTVPPDAQVWFNGVLTTSTGTAREFESPPLTEGKRYTYTVRATWTADGVPVTQEQKVSVYAGAQVNIVFPNPGT
jgi:uncharacterized protein (TIGR03000 family)